MENFPKNETFEHYALKNIGALYLKHNQLCNFVADEFNIGYNIWYAAQEQFDYKIPYKVQQKRIADAIGFKGAMHAGNINTDIKCIEAKASYSDFKNGYCIGGEYNYLIAPKDIIPVEEVPPFVGLIEIDFNKFKYTGYKLKGYNIKTRAKKIKLEPEHKDREIETMKWRMLYKLSEDKFKNHWLEGVNIKERYGDRFGAGVMRGGEE